MCIFGENYDETSIDQVCKIAREKNQKFQKKKFQAILNADKVNFRGHQKALCRIMDGVSKRGGYMEKPDDKLQGALANPKEAMNDL